MCEMRESRVWLSYEQESISVQNEILSISNITDSGHSNGAHATADKNMVLGNISDGNRQARFVGNLSVNSAENPVQERMAVTG